MSITEEILNLLNTPTAHYKGITVNIFGIPIFKKYNKQSIKNSFYKLRSKKYIENYGSNIRITKEGEKYIKRKNLFLKTFGSNLKDVKEKNLLVLFDISENRKIEREWFRRHLIRFGFIMIQKSVWVGPSPLPNDFKNYIDEIKLKDSIKTFRLAKSFTK